MLRHAILICSLLIPLSHAAAQGQSNKEGVRVEVVATASEYISRSTTASHPGRSYTNCLGNTSYFGRFNSYNDFGSTSGTADTNIHCTTTFSTPTETTLTTYQRVNYTIAESEQALYLLSCTQTWKPSRKKVALGALVGGLAGAAAGGGVGAAAGSGAGAEGAEKGDPGTWRNKCPAFAIGSKYTLTVRNTSDARLEGTAGGKPSKLEYLSSVALSVPSTQSAPRPRVQAVSTPEAKVHITSTPSGGEIYVDGKFFGTTPSDVTLAAGEHIVKITIGGKEWLRSIQITAGEISIHADMAGK